jgi:hypothetical protein
MRLKIGELMGAVEILEEETKRSARSDRDLLRLVVEFSMKGDANDALKAVLHRGEAARVFDDESGVAFVPRQRMSSNTSGSATWTYHLELEEAEDDLHLEALVVDGLDLRPYHFDERADEGGLHINAWVRCDHRLSGEIESRLRRHYGGYFTVVRRGIEGAGREMRFGQCTWSSDGPEIKHHLLLVERVYDDRSMGLPGGLLEPMFSNVSGTSAMTRELVEALLARLATLGVLTERDVAGIRTTAEDRYVERHRRFFEVDDVDFEIKTEAEPHQRDD